MAKVRDQSVIMRLPIQPKLRYKFTFEGELNISPYVAKQKANYYLVMHVGEVIVDAQTGNVIEIETTPIEEMHANAEHFAQEKSL